MIKKLEYDAFLSNENSQKIVLIMAKSVGFEFRLQDNPTAVQKSEPMKGEDKTIGNNKETFEKQSKSPKIKKSNQNTSAVQSNDGDIEYKVLTKEIFPALLSRVTTNKDDYFAQRQLILPKSYNKIGDCAVQGIRDVDKLIIPDGYVSIGSGAFSWSNIHVVIPNSVTIIEKDAFKRFTGTFTCSQESYAYEFAKKHGIWVIVK